MRKKIDKWIAGAYSSISSGLYRYSYYQDQYPSVETGPPLSMEDAEKYFAQRQNGRRTFMSELEKQFKLEEMIFCSVGSGLAAEEFLLKDKVKELVLIEPDEESCDFIKKKFPKKTKVFCGGMQEYDDKTKFDIIYTSSPSNWMYSSPWQGIPDEFIKFINLNLTSSGIFIARLYGARHTKEVLGSDIFLNALNTKLSKNKLRVIYYFWDNARSLLMVVKENANIDTSNFVFASRGDVLIKDGTIARTTINRIRRKILIFFKLTLHIPFRLFGGFSRTLFEAWKEIIINVRM